MYTSTIDFKEVPFERFGPWRNAWGYVTEIACFDDDDIVLKTITPYDERIIRYFTDWEDCEDFVMLIEHDRRF